MLARSIIGRPFSLTDVLNPTMRLATAFHPLSTFGGKFSIAMGSVATRTGWILARFGLVPSVVGILGMPRCNRACLRRVLQGVASTDIDLGFLGFGILMTVSWSPEVAV